MAHSWCFFIVLTVIFLKLNNAVRYGGNLVPKETFGRDLKEPSYDAKRVKAIMLPSERPELKIGEIIEFELFEDNVVKTIVTAFVYHGMDSCTWTGEIVNDADEKIPLGVFSLSCEQKACVAEILVYSPVAEYFIGPLLNSVVSSDGDGVYQLMELDLTKKKVSGTKGMSSQNDSLPSVLNLDKPQSTFWGHHSSDSSSVISEVNKRQLLDQNLLRHRSHIVTEDLPLNVDIPDLIVDCLFYFTPAALTRVGGRLVVFLSELV